MACWATRSLLKENPRLKAIVTVHNTQAVGAKALVGVETSPQYGTSAPFDRYDELSNADYRQRKLQTPETIRRMESG